MKKYLLIGDYVFSKGDDERHYITSSMLSRLYNLKQSECVFADFEKPQTWLGYDNLIELYPDYNGNYSVNNIIILKIYLISLGNIKY